MSRYGLVLATLLLASCVNVTAGWLLDGAQVSGSGEVDPVFMETGALQSDLVIVSNQADTTYAWGDHGTNGYLVSESDPIFAAYSNSAAFVEDVRAAQTNLMEVDPVFSATGALQADLVAVSNKAATAYGWGDHNRLYMNLKGPLVYDEEGGNLHFGVQWSSNADFSNATSYSTTNSRANWFYFNGTSYADFPSEGLPPTAYGTNGIASVIFLPTNVLAGPVYIRARAYDGIDWSLYRVAYGIGAVRFGN